MIPLCRSTLMLLAAMLTAGCGSGPLLDLPIPWGPSEQTPAYQGTVQWSCSPIDAMAWQFELQADPVEDLPLVSIAIWPRSPLEAGSVIRLDGERPQGYGAVFSGGTEWVPASRGEIGFESYAEEGEAQGWFWLKLDRGPRVEGAFTAHWLDVGPIACG